MAEPRTAIAALDLAVARASEARASANAAVVWMGRAMGLHALELAQMHESLTDALERVERSETARNDALASLRSLRDGGRPIATDDLRVAIQTLERAMFRKEDLAIYEAASAPVVLEGRDGRG